jgi:iron complex outermembrane receptor protein
VEAELLLMPVDGLTLSASYAYNSVHIPPTVNPFPQTGGVLIATPVPIYRFTRRSIRPADRSTTNTK